MKTLKRQIKSIVITLSILILLHSCKTYYANQVSMEAAVKTGKQATIIYSQDSTQTMDFDRIVKIDTTYFGIKKYRGELVKMAIPLENTTTEYQNSSFLQIVVGLALVGGLIYLIDELNLGEILFPEEE